MINDFLKEFAEDSIFSVKFIKADGSERMMRCRTGVKKYINPQTKGMSDGQLQNLKDNNILRVFDMEKQAYRSIPCDSVLEIKGQGLQFSRESLSTDKWVINGKQR